ncbi:MAG: hypothetical protein K0S93_116 [Nitrososphaeraceae archaeon]|jgi:hypothetical protein|nr:hypothetical protein [Nitrososphaeraceae archaeon]
MIQFGLDSDFTYYDNIKFLKLENNDNYSNKEEKKDSSKPN